MESYEKEIYVLDDDPVFCKMVKMIIEKNVRIKTTTFNDAHTMLNNLNEHRPSAVIIDFYGPVRGDEIIKQIRDKGNTSLIIMISADDNKKNMMDCLKSGANNVILKKNISAIPSLIMNHLNIRSSRAYNEIVCRLKLDKYYGVVS